MKLFKTLTAISFCSVLFSQSSNYLKLSEVSVVTQDRDTLFLLDNSTGRIIRMSWDMQNIPRSERPVILLVASLPTDISCKKNKKRSRRNR